MLNFVFAYMGIFGYSAYTNNWWPLAIVILVIAVCLVGCVVLDRLSET